MPFFLLVPIFWVGFSMNELFFWLHWVGFVRLCFLYQVGRRGHFAKDFLWPCWGVFLAVYSVCFSWLLIRGLGTYVLAILLFSPFFPLFFLLHHLFTSKVRSPLVKVAAAFGIFFVLESLMSRIPAMESIGLDFFFQPPAGVLCVLKFIHFEVWSSWVFATCFAISCWLHEKGIRSLVLPGALVGGMVVLVMFAHVQNESLGNGTGRTVKVALVQHNLPYLEAWRVGHLEEIKQQYRELALKASLGGPDLVIFPLYNLPGDVYRDPSFLLELAGIAKCPIIAASHVPIKAGDELFDQGILSLALLYAPEGKMRDIYQAVETPPFYSHYAKKAKKHRVIRGPFGKLGVLLCYEDMVPRLARDAARNGAKVLVALSNPGLFAQMAIIYYELLQDQIRAAENNLPLLRLSPNGYSAWIDRTGKIVQKAKLNTEEILQVELSDIGPGEIGGEDPKNPLLEEIERPMPQS